MDLIFRCGNGTASVDEAWFNHSKGTTLLNCPVRVCAPEDMIVSKAFTMESDRFDGADIAHLILVCGDSFDWNRLVQSFGDRWRVLLSHLILFGFIYPSENERIPKWVIAQLLERVEAEIRNPPVHERICNGTLLSRQQYLPDTDFWKFKDARFNRPGELSTEELERWKAEVEHEKSGNHIRVA